MGVERVEAAVMAGGERVEPRVQAGEGLAMRGQDEQVVGQSCFSLAIEASHSPSGSASGSLRLSETLEVIRGST